MLEEYINFSSTFFNPFVTKLGKFKLLEIL